QLPSLEMEGHPAVRVERSVGRAVRQVAGHRDGTAGRGSDDDLAVRLEGSAGDGSVLDQTRRDPYPRGAERRVGRAPGGVAGEVSISLYRDDLPVGLDEELARLRERHPAGVAERGIVVAVGGV